MEKATKSSKSLSPEQMIRLEEVREIFVVMTKSLKQVALYRQNVDKYEDYFADVYQKMNTYLNKHNSLELRVEAMAYKYKGELVFEDESKNNNMIYPYWINGVRLLVFKASLSLQEMLQFFMLTMPAVDLKAQQDKADILNQLWKADFSNIEYVVVDNFQVNDDDEPEEVEIEIEKIVAYLYRQLQSNSEDFLRFARISVEDLELEIASVDQIRGAVIKGQTATGEDLQRIQEELFRARKLNIQKISTILFQLLLMDTNDENFENVAEAFIQLLDALLLNRSFKAIQDIRQQFEMSKKRFPDNVFISRCEERFYQRMADTHRVQIIAQVLNSQIVDDSTELQSYLRALGAKAVPAFIEILESIELLQNRRLLSDIIAELGGEMLELYQEKLQNPSSNLVKDILYIINKINPPHKLRIFSEVLTHPNVILRMETLSIIGRNDTAEAFDLLTNVIKSHEDVRMRSQAIRTLPNFSSAKASSVLMAAISDKKMDEMDASEKKAIFTALGQCSSEEIEKYLFNILDQKMPIFGKRKVEDLKLLAIFALEGNPSINSLKKLAAIAKDVKLNTSDVCDSARAAVVQMQAKLLGGR